MVAGAGRGRAVEHSRSPRLFTPEQEQHTSDEHVHPAVDLRPARPHVRPRWPPHHPAVSRGYQQLTTARSSTTGSPHPGKDASG